MHIIHENGPENISNAQVVQGIQFLNDAFANVGYYDQGTGVDTKIQFCLAKRTPENESTNGITRSVSTLTSLSQYYEDNALDTFIKWDESKFINIWLVKSICFSNTFCWAGYARSGGIVMMASHFGSNGYNSSTIAHEIGHYLNLNHTFTGGCLNDDCLSDGDKVCDTPPDASTAHIACGTTMNSCSTDSNSSDNNNPFTTDQPDMTWNYMDYGWSCYSAFTQGQADRMRYNIEQEKHELLDFKSCLPPVRWC